MLCNVLYIMLASDSAGLMEEAHILVLNVPLLEQVIFYMLTSLLLVDPMLLYTKELLLSLELLNQEVLLPMLAKLKRNEE
jgi:hypothetical protein